MNALDYKINALTDEIIAMKGIDSEKAHASIANLLRTDMSKASVISFLKYAINVHKVVA